MGYKKFLSALTSAAVSLSTIAGMGAAMTNTAMTAGAAGGNWKFDFGGAGAASGYTGVSASDGYSASRGYGFAQTGNVQNVSAGGRGAGSDAVKFNNFGTGNTFSASTSFLRLFRLLQPLSSISFNCLPFILSMTAYSIT